MIIVEWSNGIIREFASKKAASEALGIPVVVIYRAIKNKDSISANNIKQIIEIKLCQNQKQKSK